MYISVTLRLATRYFNLRYNNTVTDKEIYLDYAAATPVCDAALRAMEPYYSRSFYNPSSPYAPAVGVRREYENAKGRLAHTIGAKGEEVIVTAGATESINLAFNHVSRHVVTSSIEHPAVIEVVKKFSHTFVEPNNDGVVSVDSISRAITPETELISIQFANNETGTVQSIRAIANLIDKQRKERVEQGNTTPLLFHCDASQGFGQLDVNVARLGVDMLTMNSAKIYGPKQVALLWTKSTKLVSPVILGGGQERGLRSGTENVAGLIGFTEAAVLAHKKQPRESKRLIELRSNLENRLLSSLPMAIVIGNKKRRLPGHLTISFPGIDAERLVFKLEEKAIYIATGSACSANKGMASHVLVALKLNEETINGSIRLTLGRHTTQDQIDSASRAIIMAVKQEYTRLGISI